MSDNISKLMSHMENNKAKLLPITNKQLETQEDFIKNGYFRMLATVVQQGGLGLNNQAELFKRWIAGIQTGSTVEDYMRQALDITVDEMMSFLETCRGLDLRYRLVLDMLMLISCDETIDDQVKLVGLYAEQLGCNKEEIELLSKMAKGIVEVDSKQLADVELEAIENEISGPIMQSIDDYAKLVAPSGIYANEKLTVIRQVNGKCLSTKVLNMLAIREIETEYVKIADSVLDLTMQHWWINIGDSELILENSSILGGEYCIYTDSKITIKNCRFTNFKKGVLGLARKKTSYIFDSDFENCFNFNGSLIWFGDHLYLINTQFKDCGTIVKSCSLQEIIYGESTTAENCCFENCWAYDNNKKQDKKITLFKRVSGVNCNLVNSAMLENSP